MKCCNCGNVKVEEILNSVRQPVEGYEKYEFIDVQFKCAKCGYDFNCVGSKEINTS